MTAMIFTIFTIAPSWAFAETITLDGGTVDVNVQDNVTNWNVTGNPVWNIPEFNIAQGSIYNIGGLSQGASLALLVNGGQATNIFGTMNLSNIDFILQNLYGINIGSTGMINLSNASLIASTLALNLGMTDFLARDYQFSGGGGLISNSGKILGTNADLVALVSNAIENKGTIEVPAGTVALAAGDTVTVGISPDGMVSIGVDEATANELGLSDQIKNSGTIQANGGKVVLDAKAVDGLFDKAINITGEPNAVGVVKSDDGVIEFVSQDDIRIAGVVEAREFTAVSETEIELQNGVEIKAETSELDAPKVELVGDGEQYFYGDMTIHNLYYATGRRDLEATDYPKTLYFEAGKTYTFEDSLSIEGSAGGYNIVRMLSSVPGEAWYIDVRAADPYLAMIGAGDSVNLNDTVLHATPSSNFGGNLGWWLNTVYWTGAVSALWSNAGNWSGGTPSGQDVVFRSDEGSNIVSNMDVAGLSISSIDVQDSWNGTITLFDNLTVTGNLTTTAGSTFNETQAYAGGTPYTVSAGGVTTWGGTHNTNVYRVTTDAELQGIEAKDLTAKYVLATDINLSGIANFDPIGSSAAKFTGYFSGAGYVLSNLTINRPGTNDLGLFGYVKNGTIEDVGLTNVNVTGTWDDTAGLVGALEASSVSNSYVVGTVIGADYTGGLAGSIWGSASISDSYTEGTVTGAWDVGGLVGYIYKGTVSGSHSDSVVNGESEVGGLVGFTDNNTTIANSYATGNVTGTDWATGGFVGWNRTSLSITDCYATGNVEGVTSVGGFAGRNEGDVLRSYATGIVTGTDWGVGGFVGDNLATIENSYATGAVSGVDTVGGFAGYNYYAITDAYATGAVTGTSYVGGFVGNQDDGIGRVLENVYATGLVNNGVEGATIGGLVGVLDAGGTVTNSFWDMDTTGQSASAAGTGKTTTQMMTESTFTDAGWTFGAADWGIVGGETYPYLDALHTGTPHGVWGTAYSDQGTTPVDPALDSDVMIALAVNGTALDSVRPGANGFYYFLLEDAQLSSGDAVMSYLTDYASDGNTVTLAGAAGLTELDIYGSALTVRYDAGSITNADLDAAKGALAGDILFSLDDSNNLTVTGDLVVAAGTFTGAEDVEVTGGSVTGDGTINRTGGAFTVEGTGSFGGNTDWTFYDLTFGDGVESETTSKMGINMVTANGQLHISNHHRLEMGTGLWNLIWAESKAGLTGITQIAAGDGHTLALTATGYVYSWGNNSNGELGDGTTTQRNTPVMVLDGEQDSGTYLSDISQISAGDRGSLALKSDGSEVYAWGNGSGGQLGNGLEDSSSIPVKVLDGEQDSGTYLTGISQISVGSGFSLALKSDGSEVYAWGWNNVGQLGDNQASGWTSSTPVKVHDGEQDSGTYLTGISQISAGNEHSLALKSDGSEVYAWGGNASGQLGNGSWDDSFVPVKVLDGEQDSGAYLTGISQISAGNEHSLALKSDGSEVYAWGENGSGQLGNGTQDDSNIPIKVLDGEQDSGTYLSGISQISAGGHHSLALTSDGSEVYAWGHGDYGQLGQDGDSSLTPVKVHSGAQEEGDHLTGISQISAGYWHSMALTSGGFEVYAWGENPEGYLGDGTTTSRYVPVRTVTSDLITRSYASLTGIMQIASGFAHTLALTSSGFVYAWGRNWYGELGNNESAPYSLIPVRVLDGEQNSGDYLSDISQIAAGGEFSLALKSDGSEVYAWGYNGSGQLGDNGESGGSSSTPVIVHSGEQGSGTYLTGISQISAGGYHALALKSDGSEVYAWGYNGSGQLGNGTEDNALAPVKVLGGEQGSGIYLTGISQIAAGGEHSLALKSDGSELYAWGSNNSGELGNGSGGWGTHETTPVKVLDGEQDSGTYLTGISQISAGVSHSLALKSDGSEVYAWGGNSSGQLGNGSWDDSNTPVKVLDGEQDSGTYLTGISQIVAGGSMSFALKSDGSEVYAWGYNGSGGLGSGSWDNSNIPVKVLDGEQDSGTYLTGISQIASCGALKSDGSEVYIWGGNEYGRIGDGTTTEANTPVTSKVLSYTPFVIEGTVDAENAIIKYAGNVEPVGGGDAVSYVMITSIPYASIQFDNAEAIFVLTDDLTASDDITLANGTLYTDGYFLTSTGGGFSMASGSVIEGFGQDVTITAAEDVRLSNVSTTGSFNITSTGGSILDDGDASTEVKGEGDNSLTADGTIGTDTEALQIEVTAGTLTIEAAGVTNGTSVNLEGTIAPVNEITYAGTFQGVCYFNGVIDFTPPAAPPPASEPPGENPSPAEEVIDTTMAAITENIAFNMASETIGSGPAPDVEIAFGTEGGGTGSGAGAFDSGSVIGGVSEEDGVPSFLSQNTQSTGGPEGESSGEIAGVEAGASEEGAGGVTARGVSADSLEDQEASDSKGSSKDTSGDQSKKDESVSGESEEDSKDKKDEATAEEEDPSGKGQPESDEEGADVPDIFFKNYKPEQAEALQTDVEVLEGAVYVVDRGNSMQLLGEGEAASVQHKKGDKETGKGQAGKQPKTKQGLVDLEENTLDELMRKIQSTAREAGRDASVRPAGMSPEDFDEVLKNMQDIMDKNQGTAKDAPAPSVDLKPAPAAIYPEPRVGPADAPSVKAEPVSGKEVKVPVVPDSGRVVPSGIQHVVLRNPGKNVFVRCPGGDWQAAADGMVLLPGDEVKTLDANRVEVMMEGGKVGRIEIKEGSLFRVTKAETDAATGDKKTLLDLAIGKVMVQAGKLSGKSRFEVRTPTAVSGVRGTVFEVTVKEKSSMS